MVAANAIACDSRHFEHMDCDAFCLPQFDLDSDDDSHYSVLAVGLDIDKVSEQHLLMGLRFLVTDLNKKTQIIRNSVFFHRRPCT